MGTFHKHGYLYSLGIGMKLNAECESAKEGLRLLQANRNAKELEVFDREYWHAMRRFALAKAESV